MNGEFEGEWPELLTGGGANSHHSLSKCCLSACLQFLEHFTTLANDPHLDFTLSHFIT